MFSTDNLQRSKRQGFFRAEKFKIYLILYCMHHRRQLSEADLICLELQDVSRRQSTLHMPFSTHPLIEGSTVQSTRQQKKRQIFASKIVTKVLCKLQEGLDKALKWRDLERALLWSTNIQKVFFFFSFACVRLGSWLCWIYQSKKYTLPSNFLAKGVIFLWIFLP